jgi:hypothetical protein
LLLGISVGYTHQGKEWQIWGREPITPNPLFPPREEGAFNGKEGAGDTPATPSGTSPLHPVEWGKGAIRKWNRKSRGDPAPAMLIPRQGLRPCTPLQGRRGAF